MKIKGLVDEDFVNYKKPSMYIAFPNCTFKCDKEAGCSICQNSSLAHEPDITISFIEIVSRYVKNPITKAVVFGGLEPFDLFMDLLYLIEEFRKYTNDDIVIYTGYTETELENGYFIYDNYNSNTRKKAYQLLKKIPNIIIKYGRFIPNQEKHYDEVLGVELASPNQYARRIS
jgi:hypothetical protein